MIRKEAWLFCRTSPLSAYVGSSNNQEDLKDVRLRLVAPAGPQLLRARVAFSLYMYIYIYVYIYIYIYIYIYVCVYIYAFIYIYV